MCIGWSLMSHEFVRMMTQADYTIKKFRFNRCHMVLNTLHITYALHGRTGNANNKVSTKKKNKMHAKPKTVQT